MAFWKPERGYRTATGYVAAASFVIATCCTGCGASCDRDKGDAVRFEGGTTDTAAGVYETSPWQGPYLDFPAGRTYRLIHGLGSRPRLIVPYLSFDRSPVAAPGEPRSDRNSHTAIGAGNQAIIEAVTADHIDVRNDTCSDIFLRVVASDPENAVTMSDAAAP
jgi:hypothetical protein